MMMRTRKNGFTLVELLIAIAILSFLTIGVSLFQRDVFFFNFNIRSSMNAQLSARAALRRFAAETREASASSLGAFPISEVAASSFTFYSDADDDGERERIRYYLDGTIFKKTITPPSGDPLVYDPANESTEMVIADVVNGGTPIFEYFNSNYDGTTAPLSFPFSVANVRLVKLTLMIDEDPNRAPDAFVMTTQVSIRNLKENL